MLSRERAKFMLDDYEKKMKELAKRYSKTKLVPWYGGKSPFLSMYRDQFKIYSRLRKKVLKAL